MADSIQELEVALNGGQRINRFRVNFTLPTGVPGDIRDLNVLVTSTSVPGKTRGVIELLRGGKTHRLAGDDTPDESFPVSFKVPKDGNKIYASMYAWYDLPATSSTYKTKVTIQQLDTQNNVTISWEVGGVWLSKLPAIAHTNETKDAILEFETEFIFDTITKL